MNPNYLPMRSGYAVAAKACRVGIATAGVAVVIVVVTTAAGVVVAAVAVVIDVVAVVVIRGPLDLG